MLRLHPIPNFRWRACWLCTGSKLLPWWRISQVWHVHQHAYTRTVCVLVRMGAFTILRYLQMFICAFSGSLILTGLAPSLCSSTYEVGYSCWYLLYLTIIHGTSVNNYKSKNQRAEMLSSVVVCCQTLAQTQSLTTLWPQQWNASLPLYCVRPLAAAVFARWVVCWNLVTAEPDAWPGAAKEVARGGCAHPFWICPSKLWIND